MPAAPALQLALLQAALQEQQQNMTPATRLGQSNQGNPGRLPSALALNAYVAGMPSAGDHDMDVRARQTEQRLADDEEKLARNKALLSDPYEAAKASAAARGFDMRRNVREALQPAKFTEGNFSPVASHEPTVKHITRTADPLSDAPQPRAIRKFTDSGGFADPDAAMSAPQRAMLNPGVIAAGLSADSRVAVAEGKAADKTAADVATKAKQNENRQEITRLARKLHDSDYLNANVGPLDSLMPTVRGGSREFQADAQRLKDLLALENRSQLKGQGAVSDFEGRMLANAGTSLNMATDEESFKRELDRIINAKGGDAMAGNEFDWIDGHLVPRGGVRP